MNDMLNWLTQARVESELSVAKISLSECLHWQLKEGALVHQTGHFFQIRGLRTCSNDEPYHGLTQPMIDQPEVGTLAFLIRDSNTGEIEWLLQAKTEPGTINGTQVAPTIQATFSNYQCVHGGKATRFFDLLETDSIVSDSAQSEQGTCFIWKFNRNKVVAIDSEQELIEPSEPLYKWVSSSELRRCLSLDFVINTDARSVIATTEWALLCEPNSSLFKAQLLQKSFAGHVQQWRMKLVLEYRSHVQIRWEFDELTELRGWQWDEFGLSLATKQQLKIGFFDVSLSDREVSKWQQPLLIGDSNEECVLLMRTNNGVAEFWLRVVKEIGFGGRNEFGPSLQTAENDCVEIRKLLNCDEAIELIKLEQSDEGSRFYNSIVKYSVVCVPNAEIENRPYLGVYGDWFNLRTLQEICGTTAISNNELRSLASLLLSTEFDKNVSKLDC